MSIFSHINIPIYSTSSLLLLSHAWLCMSSYRELVNHRIQIKKYGLYFANMHGMCYWYLTRPLLIYIWTWRGATNSGQALWKILMVAIKLELTWVCCQYELAGTNDQSQQWYLPGESKCTPVWCHTVRIWQSKRTIATNEKSIAQPLTKYKSTMWHDSVLRCT